MQREAIDTGDFVITTFVRLGAASRPLHVYIEGDGHAWRSRLEPSSDPTPHVATGLALAAADDAPNVAYLARPCQFVEALAWRRCDTTYWTGKRFSPEVVQAMNCALDAVAAHTPGQPIHLVGYSGGGAMAVLLAARRGDVASLRTVAGNLDHQAVNRLHGVSAMPESLNPIDVAPQVAGIAQVHFSGSLDTVVPPEIARRFQAAAGQNACAKIHVVEGLTHGADWAVHWPDLLHTTDLPTCSASLLRFPP